MKYSELYNFEYLFHRVLGFENKLLLKVDGRIATADVIFYIENKPNELYSNLDKISLNELGYHLSQNDLNKVASDFVTRYSNNPFSKQPWKEDSFLSLYVLKDFFKSYKSKTFDNDQVLYNVKFDGSDKTISHYLINEHSELEVIGLLD